MMNTYVFRLLALLPMGLLLMGCKSGIYVPAHQNVPLLQKKGEIQVLLHTTNLQAAAAVSNHIGVAINVQAVIDGQIFLTPTSRFVANQRRIELAVGYFTRQKTPTHPILEMLELYVGGGVGQASQRWGDLAQPISTSATSGTAVVYPVDLFERIAIQNWNLYVQPAVGIRRGMRSLSFSTKINYTSYTNVTLQQEPTSLVANSLATFNRLSHTHTLFLEPAITGAIGGKIVRVSLQVFYWLPVINQSGVDISSSTQTFARLGLALRLNQRLPQQTSD